jgi:hypothetical protein
MLAYSENQHLAPMDLVPALHSVRCGPHEGRHLQHDARHRWLKAES